MSAAGVTAEQQAAAQAAAAALAESEAAAAKAAASCECCGAWGQGRLLSNRSNKTPKCGRGFAMSKQLVGVQ